MATIIRNLIAGYRFLNEELADPRTQDYFMMGDPWLGLTLIGLYLYFVLDFGPRLMKKRQPLKLDRILQIYNVLQIITCLYVFYKGLELAWLRHYSYYCEPVDYSYSPRALEMTRLVWLYFILKVLDLLETIFFVLRKKQSQVTFLHMYHHVGMVMCTWGAVKYMAGGHSTFLGLINSFVHVIMYTYYLLSSMKIKIEWWKKYITQLQLLQFFVISIHYMQLLWEDCGFPVWTAAIMIPQNMFMTILFGDFYYKEYIKKKPKRETAPTNANTNGVSSKISNGKPKGQ